jgi:hypothetical protein
MYSNNGGSLYQSSSTFTTLTAGTYSLVMRDANQCISSTTNAVITQHSAITFTSTVVNVSGCYNTNNGAINSITATGGGSSYFYSDNGGSSYQGQNNFHPLAGGMYTVIVKDNYGCTSAPVNTTVTAPSQVVISNTGVTNEVCNGGAIGSLTVSATGGTGILKYSKNGGTFAAQNIFTALTAGTYTMIARDNNNCLSSVINVVVTQPTAVTFTTNNQSATNCITNPNSGSITVNASGGTPGYYYSKNGGTNWSNLDSNVFRNLSAATYTIKVKDVNACTSAIFADSLGCNQARLALSGMGTEFAFTVYPNPANGHAMVEFTTDAANAYRIMVTDVLGRTLMNMDGISVTGDNQRQLDVSTLARGVYMISIETGSNRKTIRLVLQ